MAFINPSLSNDLLNTLLKNKADQNDNGGYRGYNDENASKGGNHDFGDDRNSVLYVNGKLRNTLTGYLTRAESLKVNKVIAKYNSKEFNALRNKANSVGIDTLKVMPDSMMESKRKRKRK